MSDTKKNKYAWVITDVRSGQEWKSEKASATIPISISSAVYFIRKNLGYRSKDRFVVKIHDIEVDTKNGFEVPVLTEVVVNGRPIWRLRQGPQAAAFKGMYPAWIRDVDSVGNIKVQTVTGNFIVTKAGEKYSVR